MATKKSETAMAVTEVENGLMFTFPALGKTLTLTRDQLSDEIRERAMWHGLKQKCVDAAALSRNPETGASATAGDKMAAVAAMIERLVAGSWNDRAAGGDLLAALIAAYPQKDPARLREWLSARSETEKRDLRASDALRPFLRKGDSGRAKSLLDELGGNDAPNGEGETGDEPDAA